jgi:hypothetical protein
VSQLVGAMRRPMTGSATPGDAAFGFPDIASLIRATALAPTAEFLEPDQGDSTGPVPFEKIFRFSFDPNHRHILRRPASSEGRFAIVTDVRRDAVDVKAPITNGADADGKDVWS